MAAQLGRAVRAGRIDEVHQLFESKSCTNEDATKSLRAAGDDVEMLRCLLDRGADPNALGRQFKHVANSATKLKALAEYGCDIKTQGHVVLQDFADDRETIDWLLDQGVDVNKSDTGRLADGFNLAIGLSCDSNHLLDNVAALGDIALFDHLVARGADPAQSSALHSVARCLDAAKSIPMLSRLLDKYHLNIHADSGVLRDTFQQLPDEGTPLYAAIYSQNLPVVEEILRRGAQNDDFGGSGNDPIWKAVGNSFGSGFLPAVEPLLKAGANASVGLRCAAEGCKFEAAKLCLRYGAESEPALSVAWEKVKAVVERREKIEHELDECEDDDEEERKAIEDDLEERRTEEANLKAIIDMLESQ